MVSDPMEAVIETALIKAGIRYNLGEGEPMPDLLYPDHRLIFAELR